MVEKVCISEMSGDCSGGGCKDPETGLVLKPLMDACKWSEKVEALLTTLPSVADMRSRISCSVSEIAQK